MAMNIYNIKKFQILLYRSIFDKARHYLAQCECRIMSNFVAVAQYCCVGGPLLCSQQYKTEDSDQDKNLVKSGFMHL